MIKWVLVLVFSWVSFAVSAQVFRLDIKGTTGHFYVDHKVAAKESFYSLSRMYNVPPREIAAFNKLSFNTGLRLGQALKIPVSDANASFANGTAAPSEKLIPLYHTSKNGETLFRIGQLYGKATAHQLREWNHLQGDAISAGTELIVGYLKVSKEQSPLVSSAEMEGIKGDTPAPQIKSETLAEKTIQTKEKESIATTGTSEAKADPRPVSDTSALSSDQSIHFSEGYFKADYLKLSGVEKTETGTCGTFKSTSGWEDGQFYCLHKSYPAGTILKVTDVSGNRSIYAKVLDGIPDIKQNAGLIVIISNAAAEELGAGEKFECTVTGKK